MNPFSSWKRLNLERIGGIHQLSKHGTRPTAMGSDGNWGRVSGLVSESFAVLVGEAIFFRPVLVVPNRKPVRLAVLPAYFTAHLPVLVPLSPKPMVLACLVVLLPRLLPVRVPPTPKPVMLAIFVGCFLSLLPVGIKTDRFTGEWDVLVCNVSEPLSMLEFVEANHLWFSSQKQKGEDK